MVQAAAVPFKFQEVFNLTTKGLDPANFKMGLTTFESQKYICVKEGQVSAVPLNFYERHETLQNYDCLTLPGAFDLWCSKWPSSTQPTASTSRGAT